MYVFQVLFSRCFSNWNSLFFSFQWVPWPEDHFTTPNDYNSKDWTVFPLVYTFPAYEEKSKTWVPSTCARCPRTVNLLKQIPNLRTALFSKLGPGTKVCIYIFIFCSSIYYFFCVAFEPHWLGRSCQLCFTNSFVSYSPNWWILRTYCRWRGTWFFSLSSSEFCLLLF